MACSSEKPAGTMAHNTPATMTELTDEIVRLRMAVNQTKVELYAEKKAREEDEEQARQDYDALKGYTDELRIIYKTTKLENEALKESNAELELKEAASAEMSKVEATKAKRLEDELQLKEPLFRVGLAVRLRFLENNCTQGPPLHRSDERKTVITTGNAAAHAGSGYADSRIFQGGCIDDNKPQKTRLEKTFGDLYHCKPAEYASWPPKIQMAIDHEVSLRTLMVLNKGFDRPIRERQAALEHFDFIKDKYDKMSKEEFEVDSEVERRLALLREMTEKVVDTDRLTRPQMSVRRSSTTYSGVGSMI